VCPFWSNSSERGKNKSLFFKKGEEGGVFFKKWELTKISLFNLSSFTLFGKDYTKEGEQKIFKSSVVPFFSFQ
jgi:hypothetical protein